MMSHSSLSGSVLGYIMCGCKSFALEKLAPIVVSTALFGIFKPKEVERKSLRITFHSPNFNCSDLFPF